MNKSKDDQNHLKVSTLLLWKSSDVTAAGINAIVLSFLTLYCTDTLNINPAIVGILLMVSRIVEALTQTVAAWIVDNTHTKLGKGRPYELCIIGFSLCSILLFSASPAWTQTAKLVWIFAMYTMAFSIFAALRGAALNPYIIRAFHNNQTLITKVQSYGGVIVMACATAINIAFPVLMHKLATSAHGWTEVVALFIVPLTIIGILRFIFIKEDPSIDAGNQQKKVAFKDIMSMFAHNPYVWIYALIMLAFNIITSLGIATYYFKYVVGNVSLMGVVSAISILIVPIMFVFPKIMKKFGSVSKMVIAFSILGILGGLIAFLANKNLILIAVGEAILAIAELPLSYYGILFIMSCCTYNEMIGLQRMDSSAGILSNLSSKIGQALGAVITGALLSLSGYVSGTNVTAQSSNTVWMIRFIFGLLPAILMIVIGIAAVMFSHLDKEIADYQQNKKH